MNSEKRHPIAAAGLLALALATAVRAESIAPIPKTGKARANLLLVTIDTLRADRLGCYGGTRVQTPAIDALAGKGFVFTRAFARPRRPCLPMPISFSGSPPSFTESTTTPILRSARIFRPWPAS
ncbi:MAG: sulfatase-like hydrolase/transferase [Candidatus Aminicenantes bacterium]|nr:sulfatase-like hydrolase/transferase [Candidatus Aminicenantes bacterium]